MRTLPFSSPRPEISVAGEVLPGSKIPPDTSGLPDVLRSFVKAAWLEDFTRPRLRCPYCQERLAQLPTDRFAAPSQLTTIEAFFACNTCGFWCVTSEFHGLVWSWDIAFHLAVLKSFSLDDPEIALAELLDHLAKRVSDIYSISPRRFEELVGQIFRDLGYVVRLTQQSRDGGYDLVLLEGPGRAPSDGAAQTIVECKRYSADRSVSVGVVRQLLGVQLELGIRRAKIVATTRFSRPAVRSAQNVSIGQSGFDLELVDLERLTRMLGVYRHAPVSFDDDPRLPKTRADLDILSI